MSDERSAPPPAPAQALEKRPGERVSMTKGGVALQNLADLMAFAKMAVVSSAAPKGMTEGQAAIAIQVGLERGLGLMGGLQAIVVINGVVSWRGWAALGLIQQSGLCIPGTLQSWVEGTVEEGTAVGICRAHRVGYAQPFVRRFGLKDAQKAGLWGKDGPWRTRPGNMLEWRAVGDMSRFHFAEALGGIPIAEDVEAGGVGPVAGGEMPSEVAADAPPGPPVVIHDPILERFGITSGATPPKVVVIAQNAEGQRVARIEPQEIDPALVRGMDSQGVLARMSVIDAQVEEVFGSGPPPAAQPATGTPAETSRVRDKAGKSTPAGPAAGGGCPRCGTKLNAMGGCDLCFYPGEDMR